MSEQPILWAPAGYKAVLADDRDMDPCKKCAFADLLDSCEQTPCISLEENQMHANVYGFSPGKETAYLHPSYKSVYFVEDDSDVN